MKENFCFMPEKQSFPGPLDLRSAEMYGAMCYSRAHVHPADLAFLRKELSGACTQ